MMKVTRQTWDFVFKDHIRVDGTQIAEVNGLWLILEPGENPTHAFRTQQEAVDYCVNQITDRRESE